MASQTQHSNTRRARQTRHNGEAEFAHRANEALRETLDEFRDRSDDIKATVKEYVQQKPLKALGIAALSGMVLTFLLKRR